MAGNDNARDHGKEVDDFYLDLERERMRRFRLAVYIMLSIVTAGVIALLATGCSFSGQLSPVPGPHREAEYDPTCDGLFDYHVGDQR